MLKQDQYSPMEVEEQVLIIYAINNNLANDIPVKDIKRFEKELIENFRLTNPDLLSELKTASGFDDDLTQRLEGAINDFKRGFVISE